MRRLFVRLGTTAFGALHGLQSRLGPQMQTEEDHGHRTTTFPKYHCRLALVTLVLFQQALAWPQVSQQTRRVLVVSELGLGSPGYTAIRQGLVQALQTAPYHTEIYSENLEAVLFSDEASQHNFASGIV